MARAGISRVDDVEVAKSAGSTRSADHEQSREDASQKPYSPSPDAGSRRRRVPETCSPDRRCTSAVGTKGTKRRLSYEERRKRTGIWGLFGGWLPGSFYRTESATPVLIHPRKSRNQSRMSCARALRPGQARRASARARVWLSTLSPLIHDLVSECGFHI
jgi:hypothetical protein